jgi:hypothetical protein
MTPSWRVKALLMDFFVPDWEKPPPGVSLDPVS